MPLAAERMAMMDLQREKLITKDYIMIMLAATGTSFVNYFFFSTLTPYTTMLTGSSLRAGLLTTVYSLAALAVRPVAGVLSDNFGRVKLLIIGAFICALTCAGFGITTVFWLMLIIRAVNGIGFGMHSTCAGAVVADVVPKSRLAEGIGYFGLYGTVASMIAPMIALSITKSGTIGSYKTLFFFAMGLCLFSAACNLSLTYERKRKKQSAEQPEATETNIEVQNNGEPEQRPKTFFGFEYAVFAPVAVMIVMYLGLASLMNFITVFAQSKGFDNIWLYFTFSAIGAFAARVLFGRVSDKRGADIVIIPGTVAIAVFLALLPAARSMLHLALLALPLGLAQGVVMPAYNSMLFKRCSPYRRGTASGAYFLAIDTGFAIGAPVLGLIADKLSYSYIYWVAAALVMLSMVLYVLMASDKRYNAKRRRAEENSGNV